jgi:hypothetical protein
MDCNTRQGGKVKGVSIGIKKSDGKFNNTKVKETVLVTTKSSIC